MKWSLFEEIHIMIATLLNAIDAISISERQEGLCTVVSARLIFAEIVIDLEKIIKTKINLNLKI
jgi:hypothetical protein